MRLIVIFLFSSLIAHAQQDTIKTLQNVEVLGLKNPSLILNRYFVPAGCWNEIHPGDTLLNMINSRERETLMDYIVRLIPGIQQSGSSGGKFSTRLGPVEAPPTYKGVEMGVFLDGIGVGTGNHGYTKVKISDVLSMTRNEQHGIICIKFFRNCTCSPPSSGPAIAVYTKLINQDHD